MRLAAQMKAGYYPFPVAYAKAISDAMDWPAAEPIAVLDPCAGRGEAVRAFCPQYPMAKVWAVELSKARAEACSAIIPQTINTSFEEARISCVSFSAAWVNPPFDDEMGGGERVEMRFLQGVTNLLRTNGVLVLVTSSHKWQVNNVSGHIMTYLNSYYTNVNAFWLPRVNDPGYRATDVVVWIGQRRQQSIASNQRVSVLPWPSWPAAWSRWTVPPSDGPSTFLKTGFTDEEYQEMADTSPLLGRRVNQTVDMGRPPLPLKLGHIPMVLASGRFNGRIHDHYARAKITKTWHNIGTKVVDDKRGGTKEMQVQKERVGMTIKVLYRKGQHVEIKNLAMENPGGHLQEG